jgi:hypothetical protein
MNNQNYWLWQRSRGWRCVCKGEALIILHRRCLKDWGRGPRGRYDGEAVQSAFKTYRGILERDDYFWLGNRLKLERVGYRPRSSYD